MFLISIFDTVVQSRNSWHNLMYFSVAVRYRPAIEILLLFIDMLYYYILINSSALFLNRRVKFVLQAPN